MSAIDEVMSEIDDKEDNKQISRLIQITFFDDIDAEDIRKTKWLLGMYVNMIDIIRNYEIAQKEMENGMSAYDLLTAEGFTGKRETGQELTTDVTANSVVLKEKRLLNYKFYAALTNIIKGVIANIRDPHEALAAKLLFLDGKKFLKAQKQMESGYKRDIFGISATTFADKRRRAIANIANSLKINGTLDFVIIDYGRGRNKDGEIGLRTPEIEYYWVIMDDKDVLSTLN